MIRLTDLSLKHYNPDYIQVLWDVESTQESVASYRLSILRSNSPSLNLADYEVIASGINPYTTSDYLDYGISGISNKFTEWYYKIAVSGLVTHTATYTDYIGISVSQHRVAKEIIRRRALVLDRHSGQSFKILIRRTNGQTCSVCYDSTLQRSTRSKCQECYDTGFEGGYFTPIAANGQLNEGPQRNQLAVFQTWQDQDAVLYLNGYPPIKPKDVIIDKLGRRWVAQTTRSTNMALFTISQQIQVRQAERESIIYKYPITF